MNTPEEVTAEIYKLLERFEPKEDADPVSCDYICADPEARRAVMMLEVSIELAKNLVCASWLTTEIIGGGIDPKDIDSMGFAIMHFDAILEDEDNPDSEVLTPAHWGPVFRLTFKPTNGWEPS